MDKNPITVPAGGASDVELLAEYQEVNTSFRALADIRFRLLAFIPTLSAAGVYILTTIGDPTKKTPSPAEAFFSALGGGAAAEANALTAFDTAKVILIGGLGFLATLGVVYYDQRNSELYNALDGRARFLEKTLKLPRNPDAWKKGDFGGHFDERPERGRHLLGLFTLGHDTGLALIYAAALGAWLFPVVFAASNYKWGDVDYSLRLALWTTGVAFLVALEELLRMDQAWSIRLVTLWTAWGRRELKWAWLIKRLKEKNGKLREALDFKREKLEQEEPPAANQPDAATQQVEQRLMEEE